MLVVMAFPAKVVGGALYAPLILAKVNVFFFFVYSQKGSQPVYCKSPFSHCNRILGHVKTQASLFLAKGKDRRPFYWTLLCYYYVDSIVYNLRVCGGPVWNKSVGTIFQQPLLTLCHLLIILTIFPTFHCYCICYCWDSV